MDRSRNGRVVAGRSMVLLAFVLSACGTSQPPPSPLGSTTSLASPSAPSDTSPGAPTPALSPTGSGPVAESPEPSPGPGESGEPSTAGIDWLTTTTQPHFHDIATTPRGLLAVGQDQRGAVAWLSADGKNWVIDDDGPAFDAASLKAISANATTTVAVGCRLRDGRCTAPGVWVRKSAWQRLPALTTFATATLVDVAASDGLIVAVGQDPQGGAIWTSVDGVAWQRVTTVPDSRGAVIRAVASGGPGFVAVGTAAGRPVSWASSDGRTWHSGGPTGAHGELAAVTSWNGALYAAGSEPSTSGSGEVTPTVWSSADGLAWQALGTIDGYSALGSIAAGPLGIVAIAATGNPGYFSSDGKTWMEDDLTTPGAEAVISQPAGFLAVGAAGIWTTPRVVPGLPLDPLVNTAAPYGWIQQASMPLLAPAFTGAIGSGGGIYLFSDTNSRGTLRVDRYDPGHNRWTRRPAIAVGIRDEQAVGAPGGLIYLVGRTLDGRHGRLIEYNSASGRSRVLAPLPTPRVHPAVALGPGHALYVFGGVGSTAGDGGVTTVERYDPRTNRWTRRTALPEADATPGAATVGQTTYVFLAARVWEYDPRRDAWKAGATNLSYGMTGEATVGADGLIRVFGCTRYDLFDPATHHWQPGRELQTARCDPVVVAGVDARIYVFGGVYTGNPGRVLEAVDSGGG